MTVEVCRRLRARGQRAPILLVLGGIALSALVVWHSRFSSPEAVFDLGLPTVLDTVQPLGTDTRVLRLRGMVAASLRISAAAGAVSCRLIGPDGEALPFADSSCALVWTPGRTGAYRIEIVNRRNERTPYQLILRLQDR